MTQTGTDPQWIRSQTTTTTFGFTNQELKGKFYLFLFLFKNETKLLKHKKIGQFDHNQTNKYIYLSLLTSPLPCFPGRNVLYDHMKRILQFHWVIMYFYRLNCSTFLENLLHVDCMKSHFKSIFLTLKTS